MRTWILAGVFLGVLIIAFGFFVLRISESTAPKAVESANTGAAITDISITHTVKKGVHTVKGSASVPTPCTILSADIQAPSASSTAIRVDLSAAVDEGMCLELPKAVPFTLSVSADAAAGIEVYTNGVLATTTP